MVSLYIVGMQIYRDIEVGKLAREVELTACPIRSVTLYAVILAVSESSTIILRYIVKVV